MKQNQNMRVGIIGTGWISDKAAITLNGLQQCEAYAVGSRSQLTADAFAQKWHISRAYGSYAELIADPDVDLIIDNINNPQTVTVNGPDRTYIETIRVPRQITGYEYQFIACRQALIDGLLEPREMPHAETLYIMQLMDGLRHKWDVRYPMDEPNI